MQLGVFGLRFRRKTAVVLGAGATRGKSLQYVGSHNDLPAPLDADFFRLLQRLPRGEHRHVDRLLEFVRDEFGHSLAVSMEKFFTEVEFTSEFHRLLQVDRGRPVQRYQRAQSDFYKALLTAFAAAGLDDPICQYHEELVAGLDVGDSIISFNYDCLVDDTLRRVGGGRWGSVEAGNRLWGACGFGGGSLASRAFQWIPPFLLKNVSSDPFTTIWKRARTELRSVRAMILIGYSFPEADPMVRTLFRTESAATKLDLLVVVNPSRPDQERAIDLLSPALTSRTSVLAYDSFDEFWQQYP